MKKTILFPAAAISCTLAYGATSIQYDATNFYEANDIHLCEIYDSSTTMMTSGGVITLGFFDNSFDLDSAIASGNLTSIAENFNSLTRKSTSSSYTWTFDDAADYVGLDGAVSSPVNTNNLSNYSEAAGKVLYMFIGNSDSVIDSTEFALINFRLYSSPDTFFQFQALDETPGVKIFDLSLFDIIPGCEGDPNAPIDSDEYDGFYFENYANILVGSRLANGHIQLASIPEPASLTIGSLGLALLALQRRRRS